MFGMHPLQGMAYAQQIPTMQTVPTSSTSNEMSLLISESKIHHGEIKSAVSRVTERIDDLILKVNISTYELISKIFSLLQCSRLASFLALFVLNITFVLHIILTLTSFVFSRSHLMR